MSLEEQVKTETKVERLSHHARSLHALARDSLVTNPDFVRSAANSFWKGKSEAEFEKGDWNYGVTYSCKSFGTSERYLVIVKRTPDYRRYPGPYEIIRIKSGTADSADDSIQYIKHDNQQKPNHIELENTPTALEKINEFLEGLKAT